MTDDYYAPRTAYVVMSKELREDMFQRHTVAFYKELYAHKLNEWQYGVFVESDTLPIKGFNGPMKFTIEKTAFKNTYSRTGNRIDEVYTIHWSEDETNDVIFS